MNNVIEFVLGERKVLVSQDKLALTGAVLGSLAGKPSGVNRFGVLKDRRVAAVLESGGVRDTTKQVQEISNTFQTLEGKGIIALSGTTVQTAAITSEYEELAAEVAEAGGKVELPASTGGKRGRPAGSGNKEGSVGRNPLKAKRFWLSGGSVVPFGVGKPTKDKLLAECDEKGNNIADVDAINARFAAQEANSMNVKRNPVQKANLRYYMSNGTVTPFGRGKPGVEKLANECTQAGEPIDNSERVAAMRQPKSGGGGNASKVSALEAQLTEVREMMAKMMAAMAVGAVAVPAAAVAAEVPVKAEEKPVEAPKADKPAKSKGSKPKDEPKAPKVEKVKASKPLDDDGDAYEGFANVANDLGDDDPIAFGTDGFVVTEID